MKTLVLFLLINFPSVLYAQDHVVILHGIAFGSKHMQPVADYLAKEGYDVINLDYPSTDYSLEELTDRVHKDIAAKITDDRPVHFVGYSMGGLLARAVIYKYPPKHLGRVVQLASPNHGSEVADFLKDKWLYQKLFGSSGQQLTTNNTETKKLFGNGKINYELGVIAGSSTIDPISSLIITGDDDGKVSIKSTKLEGMKDHVVIAASHTFFPYNKDVQKQTLAFLRHGKFDKPQN